MSMTSWAENEVKIAWEKERKASGRLEGEWDYGCACYESALKAYNSLMEDGHSGMSFGFTKNILIRLMEHKPLTPIEDTEENWNSLREYGDTKKHRCVRMSSLFKDINDDGTVTYSDVDRVVCIDINNGSSYSSGLVRGIIDEMFPITMPYNPPTGYIKVYCEDFLVEPENGDWDTKGIFYAIMPDGERVELNKFYAEINGEFAEVSKEEYEDRKVRRVRGQGMIELKMLTTEDDLQKVTGLTHDELWDEGFDLDDWDVCFVSDIPLTVPEIDEDEHEWDEPIEDAYWLVRRMEDYCCGYYHTEYNGKHYYMVYHS